MPTATTEPAVENLCDVAEVIRSCLGEIHDRLDRLEGCQAGSEEGPKIGGLEGVLKICQTEADRALNRLDKAVKRIGRL